MIRALLQLALSSAAVAALAFVWLVVVAFRTRMRWGVSVLLLSPISAAVYAVKHWNKARFPFLVYITTFVTSLGLGLYLVVAMGAWDAMKTGFYALWAVQHQLPDQREAVARFLVNSMVLAEQTSVTEKDRQGLAVMRSYFEAAQSGLTQGRRQEIRKEVVAFLRRSDLTDEDKKPFEQILRQLDGMEPRMPEAKTVQTEAPDPSRTIIEITHVDTAPNRVTSAAATVTTKPVEASTAPAPPTPLPPPHQSTADPRGPIPVSEAKRYLGADVILIGKDGVERRGRLVNVDHDLLQIETHYSMGTLSISYSSSEVQSLTLYRP